MQTRKKDVFDRSIKMKLYTKKIICTVLAMGGVVCSSVDAGWAKRKRKERCAGTIVKAARNANAKGTITMDEIGFDKKTKNCIYTGELDNVPANVPHSKGTNKRMLDLYQGYITENTDCDPNSTVCLIDTGEGMKKAQKRKRAGAALGATIGTAAGAAPALVVTGAVAGVRGIENKQCKKMCQGHFVKNANDNKRYVLLDSKDIKHKIQGVGRNRKCACSYTGPHKGFARNATFLMRKSRKEKETEQLKLHSKNANSKTCNLLKETCIADIFT